MKRDYPRLIIVLLATLALLPLLAAAFPILYHHHKDINNEYAD